MFATLACATPALAAPIDANPAPYGQSSAPADTTTLSGVVVAAPSKQLPAVISTYPAAGAVVTPGVVVLKITFDQKMTPGAFRFDRSEDRYPSCLARPRLLPDEKTFVLLCTVGPDSKFAMQLNGPGDGGFANLADQRATPMVLRFSTKDGLSLASMKEALKSAGLKDEDDPVMDRRPAAQVAVAGTAPAKPTP
jgi:hypothetical protein